MVIWYQYLPVCRVCLYAQNKSCVLYFYKSVLLFVKYILGHLNFVSWQLRMNYSRCCCSIIISVKLFYIFQETYICYCISHKNLYPKQVHARKKHMSFNTFAYIRDTDQVHASKNVFHSILIPYITIFEFTFSATRWIRFTFS